MSKRDIVITILVIAALCTVVNLIVSTGRLNNSLIDLQGQIDALHSQINSELGGLSEVLQGQALWWEFEEIEIVKMSAEQATVKVGFHVQEYRKGSKVRINYRRGGGDYTAQEAKESSSGHFHTLLELDVALEPQWQHHYTQSSGFGRHSGGVEISGSGLEDLYEYYISVVEGDHIRAGDPEPIPLEKLSYSYYNNLDSQIEVEGGRISVQLRENQSEAQHAVTGARLELCKKGGVVKKVSLATAEAKNGWNWREAELRAKAGDDYDALRLVATFSDGKSFSREVQVDS